MVEEGWKKFDRLGRVFFLFKIIKNKTIDLRLHYKLTLG